MKTKLIFIFLIIFIGGCSSDSEIEHIKKWTKIESPTSNTLTDIEFLNDNFGVISGAFGTLLKTEDGGLNWQTLNVGINHSFMKIFILNKDEFFTSRIGLYKTSNNGNSFNELADLSNYAGTIFDMHFFNSNNGVIYKSGTIFKTNDGGQQWEATYNQAGFANKMQFISDKFGFISGGRTNDGGSMGEIHKTSDGGNNWTSVNLQTSQITSMCFLNKQIGYVSNFKKQILKTEDGGQNWETISTQPVIFHDIVFLDSKEGYAVAHNEIYKTVNGGIHWTSDYKNSSMVFSSITKAPNGNIFIVGNDGKILSKK